MFKIRITCFCQNNEIGTHYVILLHFLALFSVSQHRVPHLPQNCCFHLILDDEGFLCRVDIQATALHFPVNIKQITVIYNVTVHDRVNRVNLKQRDTTETGANER